MNSRGNYVRWHKPKPEIVAVTVPRVTEEDRPLKRAIAKQAAKAVEKLAELEVGGSLKSVKSFADALEPLARIGDKVEGWSQSQSSPTFNVLVLEQPIVTAPVEQVVDVAEVKPNE
jgi:hypothetical protein